MLGKEKGAGLMLPDSDPGTFTYFHCCSLPKNPTDIDG